MLDFVYNLPLYSAKIAAAVIFGLILLLIWSLPEKFVWSGSVDRAKWKDLRLWATLLTAIQMALYWIF